MPHKPTAPLLESIRWLPIEVQLPDPQITVLIHTPAGDEPVLVGYMDEDDSGVQWFEASDRRIDSEVTHWADLPVGPGGE